MRTDETIWIFFFLFFVHFEFISCKWHSSYCYLLYAKICRTFSSSLSSCTFHNHLDSKMLQKGTIIWNQVTFFKLFCILVQFMHLVTNGLQKMEDRWTELKSIFNVGTLCLEYSRHEIWCGNITIRMAKWEIEIAENLLFHHEAKRMESTGVK